MIDIPIDIHKIRQQVENDNEQSYRIPSKTRVSIECKVRTFIDQIN
jgi:hypothetical protein